MDLKSILQYRNKCIFCQRDLKFYKASHPKLRFHIGDDGFRMKSGHFKNGVSMSFGFNGSFQRNERNYKIYKSPLIISKYCSLCRENTAVVNALSSLSATPNIILKSRSVGRTTQLGTTFNNMKELECSYVFQIMGFNQKYSVNMNHESIRYNDEESFYHTDTSFISGTTIITHSKFSSSINDILTLRIANPVNFSKITSAEQFVDKCKKLILFS